MSGLKKMEGVGDAVLYKGDPRLPKSSMDAWYRELLTSSKGASKRTHLYGADAGLCARRNVLLQHNEWVGGTVSDVSNAYMSIGVALEDMLARGLAAEGRLLVQGQRLPLVPEVRINGIIDLVVFDVDGDLALVEVKTCGKLPEEIRPTHLAQIQMYAAVSGIRKAWVSYISRSVQLTYGEGLSVRTFPVPTEDEELGERFRVALLSKEAGKLKELPPVPAHFRKHQECHYCEFRDVFCWGGRPGAGGGCPP